MRALATLLLGCCLPCLATAADLGRADAWLLARQQENGSWPGAAKGQAGAQSSDGEVVATAFALLCLAPGDAAARRGRSWLLERQTNDGALAESPQAHTLALWTLARHVALAGGSGPANEAAARAVARSRTVRLPHPGLPEPLAWPSRSGGDSVDSETSAIAMLALRLLAPFQLEAGQTLREAQPWPVLAWVSANPERPDQDEELQAAFPRAWRGGPGHGELVGDRGGGEIWGLLACAAMGNLSDDRLRQSLLSTVHLRLAADPEWPLDGRELLALRLVLDDEEASAGLVRRIASYATRQQADGSWPAEGGRGSEVVATACGILLLDGGRRETASPPRLPSPNVRD